MFTTLISNLATLIVTVRRNVFSSVMTFFMLLILILVYSARGNIAEWMANNPSPEAKIERVERSRASDEKIQRALTADLVVINADRLLIRQFSEQPEPRTRAVIPYVTTTHIVNTPGVSMPDPQVINMPRSYIRDITQIVYANSRAPICIRMAVSDIRDPVYSELLKRSGVFEQYVCPITDIDGAPLGMIIAGYLTATKPRPSDAEVFAKLSLTATRVAGYLAEVTQPERDVWYRKLLSY